ncbi:fasciclin 1 Fas1 domain-containing isoform X2 [Oratosquilla oratoria]|uniref:fasciclin 1 Fas1 domain-containing isoform X2 n=1 Tax=Oratosquilla oratoria TaxID=337810 RepID=UPI003F7744ED
MAKVLLFFAAVVMLNTVSGETLLDLIKGRADLTEMLAIIEADNLLSAQLSEQTFTAFLPTNEAMAKYQGKKGRKLVQYHLVNVAYPVEKLPNDINTELAGNPRLYISRFPSGEQLPRIGGGLTDTIYYINNAKIISANHRAKSNADDLQILHVVDEVIIPTIADNSDAQYSNPDARRLLEKPIPYGLTDEHNITAFQKRVSDLKLMNVFSMPGNNTFFIPVNQALSARRTDKDLIDGQVVHGHVVPEHVLFTRTVMNANDLYKSVAFTDNLKVYISMENVTLDGEEALLYYVKSTTAYGDVSHNKGTVLARIIKANIPVKNGVVHLIDRPLMVVASSIMSYLQEVDGQLRSFHKLMRDHYPDIVNELILKENLTLFAPSNDAFLKVNRERLEKVTLSSEKLGKLLYLHVVPRRLTTDEIKERSLNEEETMSSGRKLYFAVNETNSLMPVVSLEGAGVNATITTPNIAAKNGIIHIIDHILGIPSQTVYEKLASDPMLSSTFSLSEQEGWNHRLQSRDQRFTIFVPSNDAWDYIKREMPSAHKKLFMGGFGYHVKYILERHMIVGDDMSLEDLISLTTNGTQRETKREKGLQMTRGKIYFQAVLRESFGNYFLEWNGIKAQVIRPDVECVNGVVHVINKVLMKSRDVTVSSATSTSSTATALLASFLTLLLARSLH